MDFGVCSFFYTQIYICALLEQLPVYTTLRTLGPHPPGACPLAILVVARSTWLELNDQRP